MTRNEAIKRIKFAIFELRYHAGTKKPSTTTDAIHMLQSVIDAIEKHRLEYVPFVG